MVNVASFLFKVPMTPFPMLKILAKSVRKVSARGPIFPKQSRVNGRKAPD